MRPVLEEVSRDIPDGAELGDATVSLQAGGCCSRCRRSTSSPASSCSGSPAPATTICRASGFGVLVTIAVAFTISLELSAAAAALDPRAARRPARGHRARSRAGTTACACRCSAPTRRAARRNLQRDGRGAARSAPGCARPSARSSTPSSPTACWPRGRCSRARRSRSPSCSSTSATSRRSPSGRARARSSRGSTSSTSSSCPVLMRPRRPRQQVHRRRPARRLRRAGAAARPRRPRRRRGAARSPPTVQERYGDELRIGVGVNSGPVVAGHDRRRRARRVHRDRRRRQHRRARRAAHARHRRRRAAHRGDGRPARRPCAGRWSSAARWSSRARAGPCVSTRRPALRRRVVGSSGPSPTEVPSLARRVRARVGLRNAVSPPEAPTFVSVGTSVLLARPQPRRPPRGARQRGGRARAAQRVPRLRACATANDVSFAGARRPRERQTRIDGTPISDPHHRTGRHQPQRRGPGGDCITGGAGRDALSGGRAATNRCPRR